MPCPQEPGAEREKADYGDGNRCVVEGLRGDGVNGWKAENDCDEADPETGYERNGSAHSAEVEGTAFEVSRVCETHGDGDAVA